MACSPPHEVFCGVCDWVGSWDDATWARFHIPGVGREVCEADDPGADPCCPACIRDTLVETEGWEDWQLPARALLHKENMQADSIRIGDAVKLNGASFKAEGVVVTREWNVDAFEASLFVEILGQAEFK